jgi:hypothetical protein
MRERQLPMVYNFQNQSPEIQSKQASQQHGGVDRRSRESTAQGQSINVEHTCSMRFLTTKGASLSDVRQRSNALRMVPLRGMAIQSTTSQTHTCAPRLALPRLLARDKVTTHAGDQLDNLGRRSTWRCQRVNVQTLCRRST